MFPTLRVSASALVFAAALLPVSAQETAPLVAPTACGLATTTVSYPGTGGPINDTVANYTPATFTLLVSGLGPFLADVDLRTALTHTDNSQIDMTLTSPAGTVVTITTDSSTLDNVFNGTLWDDSSANTVDDHTFVNLVANTPLAPEGRLEAFRGEDPNGTWTLTIADDVVGQVGNLTDWSLTITTLAGPPIPTTTVYSNSPMLPIRNNGVIVGTQLASGLGTFLGKTTVYVEIPHTDASELHISLQSPAGTVVKLSTDNGSTLDNVYNGTVFDGDSTDAVTDHVYTNNTPVAVLSPEGGYDAFLGQDPNGIWTLAVRDDATGTDLGTLRRWDLALTTIPVPTPSAPAQFVGTGGPIPDFVAGQTTTPTVFVRNVSGAGTVLWDADLVTGILHGANGQLDMTLRSPAGTTIPITTDNGGAFQNVFNGTTWDDDGDQAVEDNLYANFVTTTPLAPEGRLAAFRGEDPNGDWTLTITDATAGQAGTLTNWSLDLTTVPSLPSAVSTTLSRTGLNIAYDASAGPQIHSDVIAVAGAGASITEVEVYIEMTHMFPSDLDFVLTSPLGTNVIVQTEASGNFDNVFNGTLFDADSADAVSDHVYTNNVVAPLLAPEGGFDNFLGQNPNGNWTLTVIDDEINDGGVWDRWDLTIRTCEIPPPVNYCFGDGTSTFCPCSPAPVPHGAAGHGCPTNIFPGGALANASGLSSLSADSLVLTGTDMINGAMIFFQGPNQQSGGAGVIFGDGKRCVATTSVRRFKTKTVVGNTASYPQMGDQPISVAGAIAAPGVRHYQGWYRSANPTFCTPDTFNLTNGITVTWGL